MYDHGGVFTHVHIGREGGRGQTRMKTAVENLKLHFKLVGRCIGAFRLLMFVYLKADTTKE